MNEAGPRSRIPYYVPQATFPLFRDGEVPLEERNLRRKFDLLLLNDAHLNLTIVDALRLCHEFVDPERYSQDSLYGDEGKRTRGSQNVAKDGYFWRLDRLCAPRESELRLRLIHELHARSSAGHT
jgi:hypothetical protein